MTGGDRVELYRRLPLVRSDAWWLDLASGSVDGRVLELGAGAGRLTIGLVEAAADVVAVERDAAMAGALRTRVGGRATVLQADAAALPGGEPFGLVALPASLLNELAGPPARRAVLRAAAARCRPDGVVALHVLGPWWLAQLPTRSRGELVPLGGGAAVDVTIEAGAFDAVEGRRAARLTYRFADGVVLHDDLDAGVVSPGELRLLLDEAGLEPVAWYGGDPPDAGPTGQDPAWHVLARPRADGAAPPAAGRDTRRGR